MDIGTILNDIRDKVLDAAHFDRLKHAYDLQNDNIEQLSRNNAAFKESNELLVKQVAELQEANDLLTQTVAQLRQRLGQLDDEAAISPLSPVALAILHLYQQADSTKLYKESDILAALSFTRIQIEAAIDELRREDMIKHSSINQKRGACYSLTERAKRYLTRH